MLDPNSVIAVQLSAQQWNTVLELLAQGRWHVVDPLIHAIREQCEATEWRRGDVAPDPDNIVQLHDNEGAA